VRPRLPLFERWRPHELGHSLPVAGRLRRWAAGLLLVGLTAVVVVAWAVTGLGRPDVEPADPESVRRVALERLAHIELPVWSPGDELEPVPIPGFAPPPPPAPAAVPHPGDPPPRDPDRLRDALERLGSEDPLGAATDLAELVERQPGSWQLLYDAGLGYRAAGFDDRAAASLAAATTRLEAYARWLGASAAHQAAVAATAYALADVLREVDCMESIEESKAAVAALSPFTDAGGVRTFDRRLPYRLEPHSLTSLDIFLGLVQGYLSCPEHYPQEYFETKTKRRPGGGGATFRQAEYDDPDDPELRRGPFAAELAACIESDGADARCWAVSNLNATYVANLSVLGRPELPTAYEPYRDGLARLAFDVAVLDAGGEDPTSAPAVLLQAHRLRASDAELAAGIDALARHLGTTQKDYRVLAERFRGRDLPLLLTPTTPDEDLKGIAWAMRDDWQERLEAGEPEEVFRQVAQARSRIPDAYLGSLDAWEADARRALRESLADEIRVQKRRGNSENLAVAAGLRDFRVDWLGEAWPELAEAAWWTWGLRAAQWLLFALLALFLAGLVVAYRYAVYPYVMYTTDFYRSEFERRRRERGEEPVTGPELYERERRRRGEMP